MNILAFDTSTDKFSISILKNNKIVFNLSKILYKSYSKFLISLLQTSLKKTKLDLKKIDLILISLGPGSFTGIRLGIAAAKGMALPHKINILGFNNMEILANSVSTLGENNKKIVTIIKSKKNDYYFQVFNSKKKPLNKVSFFSLNKIPKFFYNKNYIFYGDIDIELANLIKNKMIVCKNKLTNSQIMINLIKTKDFKSNNKLDPIYVYKHYAEKN